MRVYEVIPKGFDGGTDETDHLIKWVATANPHDVKALFPSARDIVMTDLHEDEAGVDFIIRTPQDFSDAFQTILECHLPGCCEISSEFIDECVNDGLDIEQAAESFFA